MRIKTVAVLLIIIVLLSADELGIGNDNSIGIDNHRSYSDVPSTYWAHDAIMAATDRGLFEEVSVLPNGDLVFSPEADMTRAELITALSRYLYSKELPITGQSEPRSYVCYSLALKYGLIYRERI